MPKHVTDGTMSSDMRLKGSATVLLIGSILALVASFKLGLDMVAAASNSAAPLSCDLSAMISCSGVAAHWSAAVFGFPNYFIGMMAFPVLVTIAVALLAGVRFPRWFMGAAVAGSYGALAAAGWMLYMSVVEIGMLCPWCLLLDVGMLLIVYGATRYAVLTRVIEARWLRRMVDQGFDAVALAVGIALLAGIVVTHLTPGGS